MRDYDAHLEEKNPRIHNQEIKYLSKKAKIILENPNSLIIWIKNRRYMIRTSQILSPW